MGGEAHAASRPPTTASELGTLKNEIEALEALDLDPLRRQARPVGPTGAGPSVAKSSRAHSCLSASSRAARRHRSGVAGALDEAVGDPKFGAGGAAGEAPSGKAFVALRRGTVLEREYGGVMDRVTVSEEGCSWNVRQFPSLSEVALAITVTKWNGPRFFGLRSEKKVEKPRGETSPQSPERRSDHDQAGAALRDLHPGVQRPGALEQDFNSLDAQREAAEAYIKSRAHEGWKLIRDHYNDGGYSGGTMERPALQRLLEVIGARRIDIVVVY